MPTIALRSTVIRITVPIRRLPTAPAYRSISTTPCLLARSDRDSRAPPGGTTTPVPDESHEIRSTSPFYFEAGYALFAKRPSRPFPPPFLSRPSGSFSDPLSTHHIARDRRPHVNGEMIRGVTNGDDAVLTSESFIAAADGVGAWAQRERGHAALWSRLLLHFWAIEAEKDRYGSGDGKSNPEMVQYLHRAYEHTKEATAEPNEVQGTSTVCGALLTSDNSESNPQPLLHVTQLGDSTVLVLRPRTKEVIFRTTEQWHWFDCPRQLGTNSPDTPLENAVLDVVKIEEEDIVLAVTDGVMDNLWEHEVLTNVIESLERWSSGEAIVGIEKDKRKEPAEQSYAEGMQFIAQELVKTARTIAQDPFAESPFMERAVDEGLSIEGGKLDDISVVVAQCKHRQI